MKKSCSLTYHWHTFSNSLSNKSVFSTASLWAMDPHALLRMRRYATVWEIFANCDRHSWLAYRLYGNQSVKVYCPRFMQAAPQRRKYSTRLIKPRDGWFRSVCLLLCWILSCLTRLSNRLVEGCVLRYREGLPFHERHKSSWQSLYVPFFKAMEWPNHAGE